MRNPTGYGICTDRLQERKPVEYDTTTCGHCQRIIFTKPGTAQTTYLIFDRVAWQWREELGAFCRVCMRPVCLGCHARDARGHGPHLTWEQQIERSEARGRFLRQVEAG